ncbi:MAG TPA: DNA topoisomerase, partial [Candidatus Bathyarchaeia archaeon]|nr:DNA topoisomerase [Candidatus Bathyarchaeia archaeon]
RPYASCEAKEIPSLAIGDQVSLHSIVSRESFTQPPYRYNPSSILRKMEDANIGTKATRAETIETLYERDYIEGNQIRPTTLALRIINILNQECPAILDEEFTANLEERMDKIRTSEATRVEVLAEAIEHLRPIMQELASRSDLFGAELSNVVTAQKVSRATFHTPCPSCNSQLKIIRSRATGKRFVGCTGYEKGCRFTLPLPQYGTLTITALNCKKCGFQLVRTWTPGRRPLVSCPRCYLEKKRTRAELSKEPSSYLKVRRLSRIRRKEREAKRISTNSEATNAIAIGS